MSDPRRDFTGAKVMLFLGSDLLVLRRDHTPGIAWPGRLDFPGGGREGRESPEACVIRETREEVVLTLPAPSLRFVQLRGGTAGTRWYFAAHLPAHARRAVVFGAEGAGWLTMTPMAYVAHPRGIPHFRAILGRYAGPGKRPRRV